MAKAAANAIVASFMIVPLRNSCRGNRHGGQTRKPEFGSGRNPRAQGLVSHRKSVTKRRAGFPCAPVGIYRALAGLPRAKLAKR
jgi:hypothetical protein